MPAMLGDAVDVAQLYSNANARIDSLANTVHRLANALNESTNARIDGLVETVQRLEEKLAVLDSRSSYVSTVRSTAREVDDRNEDVVKKPPPFDQRMTEMESKLQLLMQHFESCDGKKIAIGFDNLSPTIGLPSSPQASEAPETNRTSLGSADPIKRDSSRSSHARSGSALESQILDNRDNDWEYEFTASIWDALFLMFDRGHNTLEILGHLCLTLLYVVLMLTCCYSIADEFGSNPFTTTTLDRLRFWRGTLAHDMEFMNRFENTSLVASVCGCDPSLQVATSQQDMNCDAQSYRRDGMVPGWSLGFMLCVSCVAMYAAILLLEVQESLYLVIALLHLRAPTTGLTLVSWKDGQCQMKQVGTKRCLAGIFGVGCRMAIAFLLLYYGVIWLCYTTTITDLLLNTSALAFLLDVDETLFALSAPHALKLTVRSLEPIPLPVFWGRRYIPVAFLAALFVVVFIVVQNTLAPFFRGMGDVANILCGANVDFVSVAPSSNVGVFWARTQPYKGNDHPVFKNGRNEAIKSIMHNWDPLEQFSVGVSSLSTLKDIQSIRYQEYVARYAGCTDVRQAIVGSRMYVVTDIDTLDRASTCIDLQEYCWNFSDMVVWARYLRLLCPETCGCLTRDSGNIFYHNPNAGCRVYNVQSAYSPLTGITCPLTADTPHLECWDFSLDQLENNKGWNRLLESIEHAPPWFDDQNVSLQVALDLKEFGCAALLQYDNNSATFICATDSFGGAAYFCAAACGCRFPELYGGDYIHFSGCPAACNPYDPGFDRANFYRGT